MTANTAVLIAAYNAAATLDRAIASALAEPETAEVCVINDCSTDATAAIAEAWRVRDGRVIVVNQPLNAGPAAARNAGIDATTSPWLTILDADDYLLPGRLSALQAYGKADFIADQLIRVSDGASAPVLPKSGMLPWQISFEAFVLGNISGTRGPLDLGFIKPLFARAFLDQHRLRYRKEMRLGEDYELYARALALGAKFLMVAPAGYISVEREGSLSKAHSESDLLNLRNCDDGLRTIRPLTPDERRAIDRHWAHVDCRLQWRRLISAVKAGDASAALSTFHTPSSALYLAARLAEQAWVRGLRALGQTPASAH